MSASANGPSQRFRGGVAVAYREFNIQTGDGSKVDGQRVSAAGMLSARTNLVGVACAVDPGRAKVTIEIWDEPAPLDDLKGWDAAAEITYEFEESASIATGMYVAPQEIRAELDSFTLDPGVYRVRAYGREHGQEAVPKTEDDLMADLDYDSDDPDYDLHKYPEEIRLQFWVDDTDSEPIVLKDSPLYIAT